MKKRHPKIDDRRIETVFLTFPKTLLVKEFGTERETRWLEFAHIAQKYHESSPGYYGWVDVCWAK